MTPFRIDTVIGDGGKIELTVPLPAGKSVEVLVREPDSDDEFVDGEVEWDDELQSRLDALDRGEIDPRPWREVMTELRERLASRSKP